MASYLDGTGLGHLIEKIKAAFVAKADTAAVTGVDIDSTPTANSTNLVTSGGVHSAISSKADDNGVVHLTGAETISGTKTFQATSSTNGQIDISNSINAKTAVIYTDWSWIKRAIKGGSVTLQQALNEKQNVIDSTHKLDYSLIDNAPAIPSAPGTLNTDNSTAQTASSSEALSGTIKLHKVSKTGSYNDLLNKPTIPTISLNGSSTTSPSFYAPTTAGTSGYVLTSNGSGAPTWAEPSGGGGDVFVATYGTTTYADILAAYNGGSTVVLTKAGSGTYGAYQTQIGTLAFVDTAFQTIVFIGGTYQTLSGKNALYIYRVASSATWTETEYTPTFQRERSVSTSKPSGGFVANTIYDLGTLTGSQTFSLATNSSTTICVEWVWSFVTGSTAPTITWPSGLTWEGGSAPTVSPNSIYEISVRRMGSSYLVAYYKEVAL